MAIIILCNCGKRLRAKGELAGRKARCPHCGNDLVLPTKKPPALAVRPDTKPRGPLAGAQRSTDISVEPVDIAYIPSIPRIPKGRDDDRLPQADKPRSACAGPSHPGTGEHTHARPQIDEVQQRTMLSADRQRLQDQVTYLTTRLRGAKRTAVVVVAMLVLFVAVILLAAFLRTPAEMPSSNSDSKLPRVERQISKRNPRIPADVSYTVIDDYTINEGFMPKGPRKRWLSVRLNKKVPKDVLRAITLELKAQENPQLEGHNIKYYLPWIEHTWAVTDDSPGRNPGYDVSINGLTQEQEDFLRNEPSPPGRELIGRWIKESIQGYRITIYKENAHYFMEHGSVGGSKLIFEMTVVRLPASLVFRGKIGGKYSEVDAKGNVKPFDFDARGWTDCYLVDSQGDLQLLNSEDKVVARPYKIE